MLRTLLHFLLLIAASWSQDTADDSVITKSPLRDNTFQRCLISKSDLSGCKIHRSQLISTSGKGSVISYSFLEKSTSVDSVLNATYPDSQLDATSTTDAFKNIDRYFFNRISNSDLLGAHIDASPQCYSSNRGFNSTIYHSRILYSTVRRSIVYKSNLTENSSSCLSGIVSSDLQSTRVSNSILQKLKGSSCTVSNSVVKHTNCEGSILSNSQTNSCSVKNTKMSNSIMSGNSKATNASLMNSVAKNSNLVGSQLTNSKVSNSKLTNCVITNSNVNNKVWDSVKMINGRIINDNRKNKQNNYYWYY